jgi:hypothetical protein
MDLLDLDARDLHALELATRGRLLGFLCAEMVEKGGHEAHLYIDLCGAGYRVTVRVVTGVDGMIVAEHVFGVEDGSELDDDTRGRLLLVHLRDFDVGLRRSLSRAEAGMDRALSRRTASQGLG